MSLDIKAVSNQSEWNTFLDQVNPNTFLHSWSWGEFQQATGETIKRLGIYQDSQLIGLALVIIINAKRGRHFLIPHGPIILSQHYWPVMSVLVNYLKTNAHSHHICAIRIAPLIKTSPEVTSKFTSLGFRPAPMHVHAERTWVLNINQEPDQLLSDMRKTTRHAIKKAEQQGVTVKISVDDEDLKHFWPLYNQTTSRHQFIPYNQDIITKQFNIFAKTNSVFQATAFYQNEPVASAILFQSGSTVFYYHGASTKLPSSVPAAQLLQWKSIKEAQRRGANQYNFWGIAPENMPHHPFNGITTFKTGFGGRAINYHPAQDLPLNFSYWRLYITELWRKYKRGF